MAGISSHSFSFSTSGWMFPPMCLLVAFHPSSILERLFPSSFSIHPSLSLYHSQLCLFIPPLLPPRPSSSLSMFPDTAANEPKRSHNSQRFRDKSRGLNDGFHLPRDQITHSPPPPPPPFARRSPSHTHTNISTTRYLSLKFTLAC